MANSPLPLTSGYLADMKRTEERYERKFNSIEYDMLTIRKLIEDHCPASVQASIDGLFTAISDSMWGYRAFIQTKKQGYAAHFWHNYSTSMMYDDNIMFITVLDNEGISFLDVLSDARAIALSELTITPGGSPMTGITGSASDTSMSTVRYRSPVTSGGKVKVGPVGQGLGKGKGKVHPSAGMLTLPAHPLAQLSASTSASTPAVRSAYGSVVNPDGTRSLVVQGGRQGGDSDGSVN
jgi:hypothetical protein